MNLENDDRVRSHTSTSSNAAIDQKILKSIQNYSERSNQEISNRIRTIENEWSIERWLETNASILAFIGVLLGAFVNTYWLFLPSIVLIFLFQHAVQGWCPPLPIFRALNVRTRKEIDWEKYALKILRGDFNELNNKSKKAEEILEIVKK